MAARLAAWGLAAVGMKPGQEPVLAEAVLKALALLACLPFPEPLRATPTASGPTARSWIKLLSVSRLSL